ncbi:MAG: SDR family NAD(P)-dependent oxidoreductase [Candidatus Woesearchaeota archaeon]
MELRNKIAIITGAARGIGRAIAIEFAKEGAKVILSDEDIDNCDLVCDEIKDLGHEAIAYECDVTKKNQIENLTKKTLKKYQKIDILVNAASEEVVKPFFEVTEEEWDKVMDINLKGVFLVSKLIGKKMADQNEGKIISISSIAGEVGFTYTSSFCASKAGVINLTRELALELSEHNINVNSITSGVLPTKITKDILEDRKTKKSLIQNIPIRRMGKPEDIAKAAVFLASDRSSYITGHNLVVDGGWLCH